VTHLLPHLSIKICFAPILLVSARDRNSEQNSRIVIKLMLKQSGYFDIDGFNMCKNTDLLCSLITLLAHLFGKIDFFLAF